MWDPSLAFLRDRGVNIFFLSTPFAYIQILANLKFSDLNIAAISVIGLDPNDPESYLQEVRHEYQLVSVSEPDSHRGDSITLDLKSEGVQFRYERKNEGDSYFVLMSEKHDLSIQGNFAGSHESFYWVTPLREDKTTYFETWKRVGIPLSKFTGTWKGKDVSVEETDEQALANYMITTDQYRGKHGYGMSFYFGTMQGVTDDGDAFGIIVQEGIGVKYRGLDRASEDHININGKVYKLDQITIDWKHLKDDQF